MAAEDRWRRGMRGGGVGVGESMKKISRTVLVQILLLAYSGHNPDFISISQVLELYSTLLQPVLVLLVPFTKSVSPGANVIHHKILKSPMPTERVRPRSKSN